MQSTYPPPPPYFPLYKHGATIPEGLTRKTVPEGYVITPPAPPPVPTGEYRVFGYTENIVDTLVENPLVVDEKVTTFKNIALNISHRLNRLRRLQGFDDLAKAMERSLASQRAFIEEAESVISNVSNDMMQLQSTLQQSLESSGLRESMEEMQQLAPPQIS